MIFKAKTIFLIVYSLLASLFCLSSFADELPTFEFSIVAKRADVALLEYAKITNVNILYSQDLVKLYRSKELIGEFTAKQAIKTLLAATPLIVAESQTGGLIVKLDSAAQSNGRVFDPHAPERIDEIVVNAQKRTERLVEIPLAVTVLDSAQLEKRSINSVAAIRELVPSLSIRKGNTSRNSSIFLRGIGTNSFSIGAEPSVATVVDGVVLSRSGQAFAWYGELERIDVLRGPQGTLFGKNASAGVINVVTKKPSRTMSGDVSLAYFDDDELTAKLNLTGPISNKFAGRVSAYISDFDGPHTNTFNGEKVNGHERKALRGVLDYSTRSVDARFSVEWFDSDDDCCIELVASDVLNRDDVLETLRSVNHNLVSRSMDNTLGGSANLAWKLDGYELTSISAYRTWESQEIADRDFNSRVENLFQSESGDFQLHERGLQTFQQFSQEFRLETVSADKLNYSVGAFLLNVDADRSFTRDDFLCVETTLENGRCLFGLSRFLAPSARAELSSKFENFALFGEGRYQLSEKLTFSLGARWTRDKVAYTHERINNNDQRILVTEFGFGAPGIRNDGFSNQDQQDATNLSGKLGLQYNIAVGLMLYTTYATGFKGPAFDVSFSLNEQRTAAVAPEESVSYEAGFKHVSNDGNFYTALNAFYVELDGFQTNRIELLNGNITSNFINAGLVVNSGLELDFIFRLSDYLNVSGGTTYLAKADIRNSLNNERLPLAPRFKTVLGVDYRMPLTMGTELLMGFNYSYRSTMFSDNNEDPLEALDALSLLNLSVGIRNVQNTHRVNVIVNNVTDESFANQIICCATNGNNRSLRYQIPRGADRYVGLEYKWAF